MRKIIFAAMLASAGVAHAADLNNPVFVKAQPPMSTLSWSGFYAGVNAGYGIGTSGISQTAAVNVLGLNEFTNRDSSLVEKGGFGGIQAGYSYQAGRLVAGVEGDFQFANQATRGCGVSCGFTTTPLNTPMFGVGGSQTFAVSQDIRWFSTARARLGWTPFEGTLLYATAGGAWMGVEGTASFERTVDPRGFLSYPLQSARFNNTAAGYSIGVGAEFRLWSNWTTKIEYLHVDVGGFGNSATFPANAVIGPIALSTTSSRIKNDVVRVGLNWNFGSGRSVDNSAPNILNLQASLVPVWTWAGLYAGLNGGFGLATNRVQQTNFFSQSPVFGGSTIDGYVLQRGGFGGLQSGYNYQLSSLVIGFEGDFQWSGQNGSGCVVSCATRILPQGLIPSSRTVEETLNWFATARARFGWTPAGGTLLYATAGGAWMSINETDRLSSDFSAIDGSLPAATSATFRNLRGGYAVGGGAETVLWGNWTGKFEYLHLDVAGTRSSAIHFAPPNIGPLTLVTTTSRISNDLVRVGLNYKLDILSHPPRMN